MKKSSVLLLIISVVILSSCASYTCPTYTQKPIKKGELIDNKERI